MVQAIFRPDRLRVRRTHQTLFATRTNRHRQRIELGNISEMQPKCNAKAQSRQDAIEFLFLRNQETRNHRNNLLAALRGIVFGRAFVSWRLCVKSFLPNGQAIFNGM